MEFLELLHLILKNIVDGAILLFEFIGVGIIIFSGLRGFWSYLHRSPETKPWPEGWPWVWNLSWEARSCEP